MAAICVFPPAHGGDLSRVIFLHPLFNLVSRFEYCRNRIVLCPRLAAVQIPPPMDRRAASYVRDQLVYEEFKPVEAPPPSLGTKDPFQREVSWTIVVERGWNKPGGQPSKIETQAQPVKVGKGKRRVRYSVAKSSSILTVYRNRCCILRMLLFFFPWFRVPAARGGL